MRPSFVVGALVLTFAGRAPGEPPAPPPTKPIIAATVNGEEIPLARVDALIRAKFPAVPTTASQLKQMRSDALSNLIDDVVLRQFLAKNAPRVDPEQINRQLQAFAQSLARKGRTLEAFLLETKQTEAELRESWTLLQQLDGYVKATVSEAKLKEYYATYKDHFDGVRVKASTIMLPGKKPATAEAIRLRAIRERIVEGKMDFAAAARKYSHSANAIDGGDLGFFLRKGGAEEAIAQIAFTLKPGDISDVIPTEFGVAIVKVVERLPGRPSTFEQCADQVRETYADDHRAELTARLRREAKVKITLP